MPEFGGSNQFGQHNDDVFFSAMQNLASGIQKYQVSNAINDANARVQEIKSSMAPGVEQRQAVADAAQNAFLTMTARGGDPAAAQLVFNNLMPKTPNSIEQAFFSDDPSIRQAASELQSAQDRRKAEAQAKAMAQQFALQDRANVMAEKRAENKDERAQVKQIQTENRKMIPMLQGNIQSLDEQLGHVNAALKDIDDVGVATGPLDQYYSQNTQKGQLLQQKLAKISLNALTKSATGMAQLFNTESERRAFTDTQPGLGKYETTNIKMLQELKTNISQLRAKAKDQLQTFGADTGREDLPMNAAPPVSKLRRHLTTYKGK